MGTDGAQFVEASGILGREFVKCSRDIEEVPFRADFTAVAGGEMGTFIGSRLAFRKAPALALGIDIKGRRCVERDDGGWNGGGLPGSSRDFGVVVRRTELEPGIEFVGPGSIS